MNKGKQKRTKDLFFINITIGALKTITTRKKEMSVVNSSCATGVAQLPHPVRGVGEVLDGDPGSGADAVNSPEESLPRQGGSLSLARTGKPHP